MKQWILRASLPALLLAGCGGPALDDTSYRAPAATALQVGRLDEAEALCRQALSREPSDPYALYCLGLIASARQEWERAIYYYQCCLDADPRYSDARERLLAAEKAAGAVGPMLRFIPLPPARPRTAKAPNAEP